MYEEVVAGLMDSSDEDLTRRFRDLELRRRRLVHREVTGDDPGTGEQSDLRIERLATDTGVPVSPADVLQAAALHRGGSRDGRAARPGT
jgi:hypothetical protein